MILVTPKQEVKRKTKYFCGVNFFLILEQSEKKTVFEYKLAFLGDFLFTCGDLNFVYNVFEFSSLFPIISPNQFPVFSRSRILFCR